MRINFACGKQTWEGFYCVDAVQHSKATRAVDLLHAYEFAGAELVNPLPLPSETCTEVHAYHFIEHVHRWESPAVLREFNRLLRSGGQLILELPNLYLACLNLINGGSDQMSMWPIYGDWSHKDPFMMHKHGYTPETMTALLTECGFKKIKVLPPKTHGARANRDMRLECIK